MWILKSWSNEHFVWNGAKSVVNISLSIHVDSCGYGTDRQQVWQTISNTKAIKASRLSLTTHNISWYQNYNH